ncbi:MAG: hypothetical protein KKD48_05115 [Nanoarchaeota archaeon]|nr:hypothetical protein [Nanoarchaeota archaeon]
MEIENKKDLEKEVESRKKGAERISFLTSFLGDIRKQKESGETPSIKETEVSEELIKAIREAPVANYNLAYDSMGEGLEPLYFWTLDFMRDKAPSGLGLEEVRKTEEGFEASASSGYFGDLGARAGVMQDRAMKILETINAVLRSIINLIYDLKEFEIRLKEYDNLQADSPEKREGAKLSLKSVWMDQVDIKKGRGSINMLSQQLQFVTLRDAFMAAENVESVKKMDLNTRVKNILIRKVEEYFSWEEISEKELRKRYSVEKNYLKGQVNAVKMYVKWIKPYLKAAQKLGMKEFNAPDIVAAFNNMQMHLSLFGKREIKPENIHPEFSKYKSAKKVYACVEIVFDFRTVPYASRSQAGTHYIHTGRTDITFNSYALTQDQVDIIEKQELYEDMALIEDLTSISLKDLQEDLDKYLKEEPKEEKKRKKLKIENPFGGIGSGFKETLEPLKDVGKTFKGIFVKEPSEGFIFKEMKKYSEEQAKELCYLAYDIYKKAHGMMTW